MTQLGNKMFTCKKLVLDTFGGQMVAVEVRGAWLELAGTVCEISACLEELAVANMATTPEQGKEFLKVLANAEHLETLKTVNFSGGIQMDWESYDEVVETLKWF